MPCNSGNSPTISVIKSAFDKRAACSTLAMMLGLTFSAIALAIATTRMLRSPWLPNLLWYTTLFKPSRRLSKVFLRSWSKKNLASAKRGRTTRSLPPITLLVSLGEMLDTIKNLLVSLPLASNNGKYF